MLVCNKADKIEIKGAIHSLGAAEKPITVNAITNQLIDYIVENYDGKTSLFAYKPIPKTKEDININNDVVFSGTGNGFATMIETVAFDAKRFARHLDLICHQGLDKEEQTALVAKHDPT
ncbi:hypothetical protein MUCCIDRAFT_110028 [Mucor lusitanicus CBS 277.49]|uniref:Uncharacterized protein n=1 Tax=Mucor lusitanicus CBS 277.49 TaxID=747725 RepID=A0A162TAS0_MUCCL|nr:hypothetical protein MUCCIDRAFT_110028 [Mucor lusitanicus CBS 277.49]